jgi:hypothetical protein
MLRSFRTLLAAVLAAAVVAGPAAAAAGAAVKPPKRLAPRTATAKVQATSGYRQAFAQHNLATSGAWCWFADPRAIYHAGRYKKTYVGWIDRTGNILVASYDHTTRRRTTAVLERNFQVDDHNNPALMMRPDGHLIVFWSGHAGSQMYYRRAALPEDVSSWEPTRTIGTNSAGAMGYTYPNPVQLRDEGNKIYLFWRGGNFNPTFSTSMDGKAWSAARTLITVPGQRPYMKVDSDGDGSIVFAFTNTHPRNQVTSIYFMRYKAGSFYRADGSRIGGLADLPFKPEQTDVVYDAKAHDDIRSWTHDVAIDSDGNPVITFATFPTNDDHRYHYARWTGTRWLDVELTKAGGTISGDPTEPNYSGGITLDHENPGVVYLSKPVGGIHEIQRWTTDDGAVNWKVEPITSGSSEPQVRPITPRGQNGGDMDVIWMSGRYPSYANFQTLMSRTGVPVTNAAPAASFTPSAWTGTGRLTVRFDGSRSTDSDGRVTTWQWNFGDGATGGSAAATHTYTRPGRFWARLLAHDNAGGRDERIAEIVVSPARTTRLLISAAPTTITRGQATYVSGRLVQAGSNVPIGGQVVEVYGRPAGTTRWTLLASPRTAADGTIRYGRKIAGTAEFTLRHRGSASTTASASGTVKVWMR